MGEMRQAVTHCPAALETLDEEKMAKVHQLGEVDRGIRALDVQLAGRHDS
jgi:hypothetical protein